ncbi:MHS family MFS transporter [Pseudonocardia sp. RS11V-5]|uniref:MFS transporter n=1 Tax=Pseudonocardia terrae TaxID=2905831 RepID=UPI001E567597|nr:MFS transporter [Pseudonocardia terrae]MCE3551822.1 MHS family MFS transporter [Pseudonocardia terrae]
MSSPTPAAPAAQPRKAALAAWIGSALEYYDFFIYGTAAALVFNKVFFPAENAAAGTLLALATFGVGYVARPVGAVIIGHIGDRFGRKRVLIWTLLLMGLSTMAIGCLPSYAQAGTVAPVLLVACRLLQGLSAAGEQAGANSMSLEHAPEGRRAFFTSFTLGGTQAGFIIATAVFLPVAALPEAALLSWGWRVPFLASAVVVAFGLVIRRSLHETPVFESEAADGAAKRDVPLVVLFRDHWRDVVRVVFASMVASVSTLFSVWALSFAVNTVHLPRTAMLWVGVLANVVALAAIPLLAAVADRIGRKPVFVAGALGSGLLLAGYLWAISTGSLVAVFVMGIALSGIVYSAANGVWPAFYAEMFPTRVRLSGMAIGTQIGFAIGGFSPTIAAAVAGPGASGWVPVAVLGGALCVVAALAALTARETFRVPTRELGQTSHSAGARTARTATV